jgi:hypothetical protein
MTRKTTKDTRTSTKTAQTRPQKRPRAAAAAAPDPELLRESLRFPTAERPSQLRTATLDELTPDADNNNRGTERGAGMLEHSLQQYGAGRGVLLDKRGRIIAGNKTVEAAMSVGLRDALVVTTDGTQLVAIQRTDLDLDDVRGRELAIADNRTSEIGLSWDAESLQRAQDAGAALSVFFSDEELRRQYGADAVPPESFPTADDGIETAHKCPRCGYEWDGTGRQQ